MLEDLRLNFSDEEEIFQRNITDVNNNLKKSKVVILGLGGLGSNIAVSLARSNVGHLKLVDYDVVEKSNLNRQYYMIRHIGMKKTEALKGLIKEINPFIEVVTQDIKVNEGNLNEIIANYPIVCEAFDNANTKAMVTREVLGNHPKKYLVIGSGMAGIENANNIKTVRKFKNLFVCGDEVSDFQRVDGMMAPRVNICAGHQANLILRIIMGLE